MKRFLLACISGLLSSLAFAGSAVLTWTNPTANVDGSALSPSAITGTVIEWGTCSAGSNFGTAQGSESTTGSVTTATVSNLAAGTYCFHAATKVTGVCAPSTTSCQSAWSTAVSKIIPVSPPNPPIIVTISAVAYELRNPFWGKAKMAIVGTVPLGTACGTAWVKNANYATVPAEAVTITKPYKGGLLYGVCA